MTGSGLKQTKQLALLLPRGMLWIDSTSKAINSVKVVFFVSCKNM